MKIAASRDRVYTPSYRMNDEADEFMAASAAFKTQSRGSVLMAGLVGLLIGGVAGVGIMALSGGSQSKRKTARTATSASAAPIASASAASASAETDKPSLVDRVAAGVPEAVKELESRPVEARTSQEATALARARAQAKRAEIAELKRKITLVPKIIDEDKATAARIKDLASDREVATDLLSMLVALPGTVGTDLVYELYRDMRAGSESAELAEHLLYSKDVHARLSSELSSLLAVRRAEKCEDALASLKKLKDDGDRRALPSLMRFYNKRGCGEKKMDDCWRCLRSPDILKDVTAEIAKRRGP